MKKRFINLRFEIIKKILLPCFALLALSILYFYYQAKVSFLLPQGLKQGLPKFIKTIVVICVTLITQRIVCVLIEWYKENLAVKTATTIDDEIMPLLDKLLRIAIWVIALLIILPFYGIDTTALITALGVSSLAIALAAQDSISNVISGLMIMIDRPFKVGDKIKLSTGEIVEVIDIGMRRSKFLAEDKAIVIIPNLELSKRKIVNYTYSKKQ